MILTEISNQVIAKIIGNAAAKNSNGVLLQMTNKKPINFQSVSSYPLKENTVMSSSAPMAVTVSTYPLLKDMPILAIKKIKKETFYKSKNPKSKPGSAKKGDAKMHEIKIH